MSGPIHVLLTVDVESRRDGCPRRDVWGELDDTSEPHGIGRMMDILDRHGVQGTFFVDVFAAARHGDEAIAAICREILRRKHDLQLHTHPKVAFGIENLQDADLATQVKILKQGADSVQQWTGASVVAHRSGNYMASVQTFEACSQAGIPLEFSYNAAWQLSQAAQAGITRNAPFAHNGVLCVPVSCHVEVALGRWTRMRFLDIESSSVAEIRKVVSDLRDHGVPTAVIMMHSFSFCRDGRVNTRSEEVLETLLRYFTADSEVRLVCAKQLCDIWRAHPDAVAGPDYVPTTGYWMTYCRAWQRRREGWRNLAVALAPLAVLTLVAGMAITLGILAGW